MKYWNQFGQHFEDGNLGRLILIRHCETESNANGLVQGQSDEPLSMRGVRQAALVGAYVNERFGLDRVVSSDLSRCVDTAADLNTTSPVVASPLLRELDFGDWEGQKWSDLHDNDSSGPETPEMIRQLQSGDPSFAPPGGESISSLNARVERLIEEQGLRDCQESIAVISHAGVLRSLTASLLNWPSNTSSNLTMFVGSVSSIFVRRDIPRLELLNYFEHLTPSYA